MAEEYRGFSLTNIEELEQQAEENSDIIEQLIEGKGTGIHPIVAPDTDHEASGVKCTLTAGENLVFGEVCYLKSDGKMWKADADDTTKLPTMAMVLETISADASGDFLLYGFVRDDTWNWTVGGKVYLNTTAGALTQTAPSNAYLMGIATHANRMIFNPDYHDTNLEAYLAIGSANKRYIQCILEGSQTFTDIEVTITRYQNAGANDCYFVYAVPLPFTLGSLKLYIDRIRLGLTDADANDYVDSVSMYIRTDYDTGSYSSINDGTNRTAPGEYDYDFTAIDCSSAKRLALAITIVATDARDLDIGYVMVRYYYDD